MFSILRRYTKYFSLITLLTFSFSLMSNFAHATGGPKQPEVKTFTPIGTSGMVDPFTGNFSYNIPLLDVGGYPVNISYTANPSMEADASWVGLGWNINVGAIDRNMRGIPDDFSGDTIVTNYNRKINRTVGVDLNIDLQVFGLSLNKAKTVGVGFDLGASIGGFRNNYTGTGSVVSFNAGADLVLGAADKDQNSFGLGCSATSRTSEGLTIQPSLSYKHSKTQGGNRINRSIALGSSYNTLHGLKDIYLRYSVSSQELGATNNRSYSKSGSSNLYTFAYELMPPAISTPTFSMGLSFNASVGASFTGFHPNGTIRAHYSQQRLASDFSESCHAQTFDKSFFEKTGDAFGDAVGFTGELLNFTKSNAQITLPAYGYLYAQDACSDKVLLDFSREKDGGFTPHKPYLPIPNFTHDVYSVNGQGLMGSYRPFRNDVGILHDPEARSHSANVNLPGLEVGGGNLVHFGTNFSVSTTESFSGKWSEDEGFDKILDFRDYNASNRADFQPYYFKQAGEKSVDFSSEMFTNVGAFDPVRVLLTKDSRGAGDNAHSVNSFQQESERKASTGSAAIVNDNTKKFRQPRSQDIQFLNAREASNFAMDKSIPVFEMNTFNIAPNGAYEFTATMPRVGTTGRLSHHMSEITATRSDGTRYIYGIPVYNLLEKNVSFSLECDDSNVNFLEGNCQSGLVTYDHGSENSINNDKGIEHHFEERITPPYAGAFLLTQIVSDDYVDVTDDGATDDDYGSYTKFNYSQAIGEHHWRIPFQGNSANYFEGFNSNPNDGKGSYIYGKRELWYLHSIVTKTHVAEFILADRSDALGANGEAGGIGDASGRMKKLVRIDLFSKPDKLKEAKSGGAYKAVPVKSVHFEYDYSLCLGVPNNILAHDPSQTVDNNYPGTSIENAGGKLTLKKIFFTYQNSNKARLSPYEFEYGSKVSYNEKAHDRWGNYKSHLPTEGNCEDDLSTVDFPYTPQIISSDSDPSTPVVLQNKIINGATVYDAWNLNKITLPSGAVIKVDYESDDYAYVQNRPAMQMFKIEGTATSKDAAWGDQTENNNFIFFKLAKTISDSEASKNGNVKNIIRDLYLKQMVVGQATPDKLYFRCFAKMPHERFDYVPGYASIDIGNEDAYGAIKRNGSTTYNYGYVKIKHVKLDDDLSINPIQYTAINLLKMNFINVLEDAEFAVRCGDDFGDDLKGIITGFASPKWKTYSYSSLTDESIGKEIKLEKSMIRLYNPYQNKLGGGSRVKRITINDNWNSITSTAGGVASPTAVYGQEYDYTMPDGSKGIMSSGVASYEPAIGSDENPFSQPIIFNEQLIGVPDEEFTIVGPMGESYFPSPTVGYSRVTVRDIATTVDNQGNNILPYTYPKTGKVVNEFFTARDFPTITDATKLDRQPYAPHFITQIFKLGVTHHETVSQGYVIELNDMHGKPKGESVYQESKSADPTQTEAAISSVSYKYKTDPATGLLDNNVLVMNRSAVNGKDGLKNNFIETRTVGIDYDVAVDMREERTNSVVVAVQGNLETFLAAIFPILVPIVLPNVETENVRFRSAVTSKVINRTGLLDQVITQDLGKLDVVKNVLYDAETGDVLLTQGDNEYNDPVYTFNYPAYYAYDGMGPSYKNTGCAIKTSNPEVVAGASDIFFAGDEVLAFNADSAQQKKPALWKAWVKSVNGDNVELIDKEGYPLKITGGDGNYMLKILRSGRRNKMSSSMGTVTTLNNPLSDSNSDGAYDVLSFSSVLDAKAVEYENEWKVFCNCTETVPTPDTVVK